VSATTTAESTRTAPRIYGGESTEMRIAKRRSSFIAAGQELFGTIGYRKTTMRSLCKLAGLTDRYFYESFACMEDLLEAVYSELVQQMQLAVFGAVQRVEDKADPEALASAGLDAFLGYAENPATARIIWLEVLGVSPRIDQLYDHTQQQFALFLHSMTKATFPNWISDEQTSHLLARPLISAASGSAMSWLLSDYKAPKSSVVEALMILFRGLIFQAREAK